MISIDQWRVIIGGYNASPVWHRSSIVSTKARLSNKCDQESKNRCFGKRYCGSVTNHKTLIKLNHLSLVQKVLTIANILIFVCTPYLKIERETASVETYQATQQSDLTQRAANQFHEVFPSYKNGPYCEHIIEAKASYILLRTVIETKLVIGNIEREPGPTFFEKSICGSFDQSHPKFGNNRGMQCASIALYSLAFSSIKRPDRWTKENFDSLLEFGNAFFSSLNIPRYLGSEDLPKRVPILKHGIVAFSSIKRPDRWTKENFDSLLEFGNAFFSSLNIPRYLGSEDLPKRVPILKHGIDIEYTFNTYGILTTPTECKQQLNKFIVDNVKGNTGFLMWIGEVTISVMFQQQSLGRLAGTPSLIVIDSHCRNELGETSDIGASILMTFSTADNFVQYIVNTYVQQASAKGYQLQFTKCLCTLTSGQCHYISHKHVSLEKQEAQKVRDKERFHLAYIRKREGILQNQKLHYSTMNTVRKTTLLDKAKERYKGMDNVKKKSLLDKLKLRHRKMHIILRCIKSWVLD